MWSASAATKTKIWRWSSKIHYRDHRRLYAIPVELVTAWFKGGEVASSGSNKTLTWRPPTLLEKSIESGIFKGLAILRAMRNKLEILRIPSFRGRNWYFGDSSYRASRYPKTLSLIETSLTTPNVGFSYRLVLTSPSHPSFSSSLSSSFSSPHFDPSPLPFPQHPDHSEHVGMSTASRNFVRCVDSLYSAREADTGNQETGLLWKRLRSWEPERL